MHDTHLLDLIAYANGQPPTTFRVHQQQQLTGAVTHVAVSFQLPGYAAIADPYLFYLLYNPSQQCVAVLYDAQAGDLHWLVCPTAQQADYVPVLASVRDTVLPHLLQDRSWQRVSLERGVLGSYWFCTSQRALRTLGFGPVLAERDRATYRYPAPEPGQPTQQLRAQEVGWW